MSYPNEALEVTITVIMPAVDEPVGETPGDRLAAALDALGFGWFTERMASFRVDGNRTHMTARMDYYRPPDLLRPGQRRTRR